MLTWWHDETLPDGCPVRDGVRSIAMPGLGTGVGTVPPEIGGTQVARAWDELVGSGAG